MTAVFFFFVAVGIGSFKHWKTYYLVALPDINTRGVGTIRDNYANPRPAKSRVCITVENFPNPSSVYIRRCKHRKKVFYCFYKITSSKNYNAGKCRLFYWPKRIFLLHWFDDGIFQLSYQNLHIENLVVACLNSCIFTSHNHVYILSYSDTPLGQSESANYFSYFIIVDWFIVIKLLKLASKELIRFKLPP